MPENMRSKRNGSAGVIAFREWDCQRGLVVQVLVVNKRDGKLGFPKGGAEGEEDPRSSALREYVEETSLPAKDLSICEGVVLIDIWRCHYYVAEDPTLYYYSTVSNSTVPEPEAGTPGCKRGWKPVAEDPADRNPVVFVQWKEVSDVLEDDMMSSARKKLLCAAKDLWTNAGPQEGLRNQQQRAAERLQDQSHRDELDRWAAERRAAERLQDQSHLVPRSRYRDVPRPKNMADIDALFKLGGTVNVENAEATEAATPVHDEQD
jgi:8-oxo-dGTP pyrophosphatase MutT (NUDIX family)